MVHERHEELRQFFFGVLGRASCIISSITCLFVVVVVASIRFKSARRDFGLSLLLCFLASLHVRCPTIPTVAHLKEESGARRPRWKRHGSTAVGTASRCVAWDYKTPALPAVCMKYNPRRRRKSSILFSTLQNRISALCLF